MATKYKAAVAPTDDSMDSMDNADSAMPETMTDEGAEASRTITLDMTDPTIAQQFSECEPGEKLTVESKDDKTLVLLKGEDYGVDSTEAAAGEAEPADTGTTGVDELIRRKSRV